MARKKAEKTDAQKWGERISRAKEVREKWKREFRVKLAYAYWEGRNRPPHISESEWISLNLIYSTMNAELPSLYSTDPYFYVSLKKSYSPDPTLVPVFEGMAKIRAAMLNYLKGELRLKTKARLSIFDAYFQYGVLKTHLTADLVENPQAGEMMMSDDGMTPLLDEQGMPMLEPEYLPANQMYCVSRIHPDDFLVDEDAGPLADDVSWRAHRIRKPLDEVKSDKKYKKAGRDACQATEIKGEEEKEREERKKGGLLTGDSGRKPDIVVLWEVWDRKNRQFFTVADGCNEFLTDPALYPPGIEDDPFVDLRFTLRDDSWYPLPPISQWIDPQREYCLSRSKRAVHRKRFNRKYTAYAPAFDDPGEAMSKLENGEDGTVILQNQPMQTVYPIQDAPLDQQEMVELTYLRQDFADLSGSGPNQRGSTAGVDSATESGILEQRARLKEGDKRGLVQDFLVEIARKLDQLVQANITEDQAVKVTGPQGEYWEMIRQQDYEQIAGEYEYSIDAGSTLPQTPEIARAQWVQFLGAIQAMPQLMLSKSFLKKTAAMFEISDEALVEELFSIGQQMMGGQIPMPGQTGTQPGGMSDSPLAALGGAAMGINNIRGGK